MTTEASEPIESIEPVESESDDATGPVARRRLFAALGAAAAGAAVFGTAKPAGAIDGDSIDIGESASTASTNPTVVNYTGSSQVVGATGAFSVVVVDSANPSAAIHGESQGTGYGVSAVNFNATSGGALNAFSVGPSVSARLRNLGSGGALEVYAESSDDTASFTAAGTGRAIDATSAHADGTISGHNTANAGGVVGSSNGGVGWLGLGDDGVFGQTSNGRGVVGNNTDTGMGVYGRCENGVGIVAESGTGGIPFRIVPASGAGAPTTGTHTAGQFVVDSGGDLYFCTTGGSPGTFVRLNGGGGGGGPTFLAQPQRAYDSRSNQSPSGNGPGQKGKFTPAQTKVIDLTVAGGLPNGATAAIVNLTLANTGGPGYASVYADEGSTLNPPPFSSINFSGAGQQVANEISVAVSNLGKIRVYTSNATDVIIDVVGSYS